MTDTEIDLKYLRLSAHLGRVASKGNDECLVAKLGSSHLRVLKFSADSSHSNSVLNQATQIQC